MHYQVLISLLFCAAIVAGAFDSATSAGAQTSWSLDAEFEAAANRYGVPKELLLAMGYVNTRREMPPPEASEHEEAEPKRSHCLPSHCGSKVLQKLVESRIGTNAMI